MGFDWRASPWISLHATASYGSTFIYLDNVPRKLEVVYGFRVAPFFWSDWAVLRCFRVEAPGFYMYFPTAREGAGFVVPFLPYLYWQWGG